jgi:hypothetical protein
MLYMIVQQIIVEGESGKKGDLHNSISNGELRKAFDKALSETGFEVKVVEVDVRKPWRDEAMSVPRKHHFRADTDTDTLCGYHANRRHITEDKSKVTCKVCKRKLKI